MKKINYIEANRLAWNEVAPIHAEQNQQELIQSFQKPGYSCLDAIETQPLIEIDVTHKAVAQLCCNNGRELLSIKNMGADYCVGFDISDNFIAQAQELAATSHIDCEFLQTDIYNIPISYNRKFDLVYISIGAICWMPDLTGFFAVIARLLKPAGYVFIYDMHPILNMFLEDDQQDPPQLANSYFNTEANKDENGLDYYSLKKYSAAPAYWFPHKMSDVINTCIQHDLNIKKFIEYPHDISGIFGHFEKINNKLPLSYILTAQVGQGQET